MAYSFTQLCTSFLQNRCCKSVINSPGKTPSQNQVLLGLISPCTKKDLSPTFDLPKNRICMDIHFKEKLTDLFCKLSGIYYPHRQSRKKVVNTVVMLKYYPPSVKYILEDKLMFFTHFYIMQRKIRNLVCVAGKQKAFWR